MNHYNNHESVLLDESIKSLKIKNNGIYIDCTLGRGGHSLKIIESLSEVGKLICFDKDITAINFFDSIIKEYKNKNIFLINSDFRNIVRELKKINVNKVDGIFFDLGVSSPQLDDPTRGFSYRMDGPLDMRMDINQKLTAWDVVNKYDLDKLAKIFKEYGESKFSFKVAKTIVEKRIVKEINTTLELVEIIKLALPIRELYNGKHPARQFFQAIRIEVNSEIEKLEEVFYDAISLLSLNGILSIITFHSLEDRIVKNFFKKLIESKIPSYIPTNNTDVKFKLNTKIIYPTESEIKNNNRSRSAKLRSIQRKEL